MNEKNPNPTSRDAQDSTREERAMFLLKALTDIDDRFLEEAAPVVHNAASASDEKSIPSKKTPSAPKTIFLSYARWKSWSAVAAGILLLLGVRWYLTIPGLFSGTSSVESQMLYENQEAAVEGDAFENDSPIPSTADTEAGTDREENRILMNQAEDIAPKSAEESKLRLANPWSDWNTLEEAEKATGIHLSVPSSYTGQDGVRFHHLRYRSLESMLEILYTDDSGTIGLRIRKSGSEEPEIRGDYNEYKTIFTEQVSDHDVLFKGDTAISLASWEQNGFRYSVAFENNECPLPEARRLISEIH